tara:strand:- start:2694 stop:5828 length:3135 start_codon:yes stop_codon:yes gene_type:complete
MAESISDFKRKYQERMGEATGITTADLNESMGNPMTEEVEPPISKPSPAVIAQLTRGTKFTKDFKEVPKVEEDIFGYSKSDLKKAIVAHEVGPYLKSIDSPYFFTGVSKKKNSSSGFGPGQITSTTVEDLLARYPSRFDEEFKQYAEKFIAQGKNKLNIDYYNSLYKDGKKIRTTKKDKEIFGGLGVGNIPREQHDKHYDKLFDLVIEDKLKQSDSIDSFLKNYHGSTKQSENQKYIKNVMGYLDNPNSIQEEIRKQTEGNEGKFKQAFDFIMSYLPLNEGGMAQAKQIDMFDEGGLLDEGGEVDKESGNEVPPGSLRKEVRDDIPAMLSEGEFVFPADVVRFIGLEKLMALRQEAKAGLKRMEEMGQMGNSEDATLPDDIPFTIDDLELEEEEPMMRKMQQGGDVYDMAEFEGQQTAGVQPGAGALVGQPSGKTQFSGVKTYRGPDGTTVNIPGSMVDGRFVPLYPIPEGYELVGDYVAPVEDEQDIQAGPTVGTTQPSEDRERAIQVKQEEEEMRDRSYDGYVQSILTNAGDNFDGTFESLLANRDKATFGETGIRMPQFLFNEEGMLEAFNRLKSDVPTPTPKPSPAQRTADSVAGEAAVATEIDPRLEITDDETFGLSGVRTTPIDPRGEVTRTELPPLVGTDSGVSEIAADEKGPKPRPKGRFISTAYSPGTGEIEIERDPNTNEFFFLDENRNRKGSPLSPANKLKFGLLDTQVTDRVRDTSSAKAIGKGFTRTEPDYSTTFEGAFNTTRGGFFFEPDEKQDKTDDPGMEEFTELQRQTNKIIDDGSATAEGERIQEEERKAQQDAQEAIRQQEIAAQQERKRLQEAEAKAKIAQAEAKAAADKAAAERKAIEDAAEQARLQREQSEKDQREAERVSNIMSGVSGAEAGSVVRTREPGGTVKAKEGGKSAKQAAQQVAQEKKEEKEDKGSDKIICTAMNNQYGFGSFRQAIWLNQSKTLDKHYQIGYHTIFKPLVRYAYKDNNTSNKIIRKWLEGVARRRTADIWMQKKGKRHWAGAVERAILEPLCYIVGKLNGRTN